MNSQPLSLYKKCKCRINNDTNRTTINVDSERIVHQLINGTAIELSGRNDNPTINLREFE